jgi:hypothetical protein
VTGTPGKPIIEPNERWWHSSDIYQCPSPFAVMVMTAPHKAPRDGIATLRFADRVSWAAQRIVGPTRDDGGMSTRRVGLKKGVDP